MSLEIRSVPAINGWRWIIQGILIFRTNPTRWILMAAILFAGARILLVIPLLGAVLVVLLAPNFLAGLSHGAQAAATGKELRVGYLISGFLKNAAPLITIGGISLLGQLLALLVMTVQGGDAINTISRTLSESGITPETVETVNTVRPQLLLAVSMALLAYLPVLMAAWFSPLLVFFDDMKPLPAMLMSLRAMVRNVLPFLVYSAVIMVPVMILTPLSMAARQPDLALWLLMPLLAPSVYAAYRDVFVPAAPETPKDV